MKPLIDGRAVDREIAEETPCPECGSSMHYEARDIQHFGSDGPKIYHAFAVCDNPDCKNEIEF